MENYCSALLNTLHQSQPSRALAAGQRGVRHMANTPRRNYTQNTNTLWFPILKPLANFFDSFLLQYSILSLNQTIFLTWDKLPIFSIFFSPTIIFFLILKPLANFFDFFPCYISSYWSHLPFFLIFFYFYTFIQPDNFPNLSQTANIFDFSPTTIFSIILKQLAI